MTSNENLDTRLEGDGNSEEQPFAPLPRPSYQLRTLPIRYRWEVTRRHPIYQDFWNDVSEVHATDPYERILRLYTSEGRHIFLAMIGVNGPSISPSTEFEDIPGEQTPDWMTGSVHPITIRQMLFLALAQLPPGTLGKVFPLFAFASYEGVDEESNRIRSLLDLSCLEDPSLDQYVDELIVSISPRATVRQFQSDATEILEKFRREREIQPGRIRDDRYSEYLRIWDMREGWEGGQYISSREMTLREIAAAENKSLSTVSTQYRNAFQLITGHRYSPNLWFRVMGPIRFTGDEIQTISEISRSRPRTSPTPRDVPDSVVSNPENSETVVSSASVEDPSIANSEMLLDFTTLLAEGLSDEEIARRLNPHDPSPELVASLRELLGDRPDQEN